MNNLYIYGDESGDTGFDFKNGSSRYFVISLIMLNDPEPFRLRVAQLRRQLGLPAYREFKFNKTPDANRLTFLKSINTLPFVGYALVVDKQALPMAWQTMRDVDFYTSCFVRLMSQIPIPERKDAMLVLDQYGNSKATLLALRRKLKREFNVRGQPFKKMSMKRSKGNDLLQCADMVAGAIMRAQTKKDARFLRAIRGKVLIMRHPQIKRNPPS